MADYAGDITVEEAWRILSAGAEARLVDVRTRPEWTFVGVPDLSSIGKEPAFIQWQVYPEMKVNDAFAEEIAALGVSRETPLLFLCRSGARSRSAAIAMTQAGYRTCYNVAGGFEGDPDPQRHRGGVNGWKAARLPWVQQ